MVIRQVTYVNVCIRAIQQRNCSSTFSASLAPLDRMRNKATLHDPHDEDEHGKDDEGGFHQALICRAASAMLAFLIIVIAPS
jgi:hypothetical protein